MVERGYSKYDRERNRQSLVNVGIAPEKKEGKAVCEDSKINDPDKGLFMVADGLSKMNGAKASRFVGMQMQRFLGAELDRGIQNNLEASGGLSEKISNIDLLVKTTMVEAINDTHERLRNGQHPESGTTVSVVKLVDLPNEKSRMYFANVGDSRIYVVRNGKIKKLTKDDNDIFSMVGKELAPGVMFTARDAETIDQARSVDDLSDDHRMFKNFVGHTINRVVGQRGNKNANLGYVAKLPSVVQNREYKEVQHVDLQKGDRIVVTSDGVHGQLLETEMAGLMQANSGSALEAETALQTKALEISHGGKGMNPRSTKDDISAVVHDVGAERSKNTETKKVEVISDADLESWRATVKVLFGEMRGLKRQLDRASQSGSADEVLELRRELNAKQIEWAQYDYSIRKVEYDRAAARYNRDDATALEKQEMALFKNKKDNAERRYHAYAKEAKKLG